MYTLRIIEDTREEGDVRFDQVIENFELGTSYSVIKKGIKEFDNILNDMYPNEDTENIRCLICAGNGDVFFIYKNNDNELYSYFIMTESGKTFEKL